MIRIVKNFYDDPEDMMNMAFSQKYDLISHGHYPGKDSVNKMIITPELERKIRKIFPDERYKIVRSRFRYATDNDMPMGYVHADTWGRKAGWHILIYLTKNPPIKDGLVLYETKEGLRRWVGPEQKFIWDFPDFSPWNKIEYEFNEAIIFDYSYLHAPEKRGGFGDCMKNSRLLHIIEVFDVQSPAYNYGSSIEGVSMSTEEHPDTRKNHDETLAWSDAEIATYERVEYLEI